MTRKAIAVVALSLGAGILPLRAEMSVSCSFGLFRSGYETLKFCGRRLDAGDEAKYQAVFQKYQRYISANGGTKYEFDTQESLDRLGQNQVCSGLSHELAVSTFFRSISDEGMAAVDMLLSRAGNPDLGDCP